METENRLHNVVDINLVTDDLFELVLERNDLTFTPGDCVALFATDGVESRPYSISSGANEDHLRFIIRTMPDGVLTSYLKTRTPGDLINVSPPFGWFRPGQDVSDSPCVFIATGTGIAPFLSYCRTFPDRPPACCLYGVRYEADAIGLEELQKVTACHLAVSRETPQMPHQSVADTRPPPLSPRLRVTDLLDKLPLSSDTHYYICGLDAMINEVSAWLEDRDVDIFNIHREVFFNDSKSNH